jgi:hypothetical protein
LPWGQGRQPETAAQHRQRGKDNTIKIKHTHTHTHTHARTQKKPLPYQPTEYSSYYQVSILPYVSVLDNLEEKLQGGGKKIIIVLHKHIWKMEY